MDTELIQELKTRLITYILEHSLCQDFSKVSCEWESLGNERMAHKSVACPCGRMITETHLFSNKNTGRVVALGDGCKKYLISYGINNSNNTQELTDYGKSEQIINRTFEVDNEYYSQKLLDFYSIKISKTNDSFKFIKILECLVKRHNILIVLIRQLVDKYIHLFKEEHKKFQEKINEQIISKWKIKQEQIEYDRRIKQHAIDIQNERVKLENERKMEFKKQMELENKYCENLNLAIALKNMRKSSFKKSSFYT